MGHRIGVVGVVDDGCLSLDFGRVDDICWIAGQHLPFDGLPYCLETEMDGLSVSHAVAYRNGLVFDLRCPQRPRVPIKDAGNVIFAFALEPLSLGDIMALHG